MTEQDFNTMPMDKLTEMVSNLDSWQLDTENPQNPQTPQAPQTPEQDNHEAPKEDSNEPVKEEEQKEGEQQPEVKEEKKTPESIKKLLHQRSELRQDNDRLKTELEEAKEQLRKLRSWELDWEFKNSEWEVDTEKKNEAIQDASFNSKLIERELDNSNRTINSSREGELNKFFADNPDLSDVKDDIVEYASSHKDLDIEDIKYLVLSKIDPTRLLDEQTKNKLSGNYSIPWKSYDWKQEQKVDPKTMPLDKLQNLIVEKGLI